MGKSPRRGSRACGRHASATRRPTTPAGRAGAQRAPQRRRKVDRASWSTALRHCACRQNGPKGALSRRRWRTGCRIPGSARPPAQRLPAARCDARALAHHPNTATALRARLLHGKEQWTLPVVQEPPAGDRRVGARHPPPHPLNTAQRRPPVDAHPAHALTAAAGVARRHRCRPQSAHPGRSGLDGARPWFIGFVLPLLSLGKRPPGVFPHPRPRIRLACARTVVVSPGI